MAVQPGSNSGTERQANSVQRKLEYHSHIKSEVRTWLSAGAAGEAARWGGSSLAMGMTANPFESPLGRNHKSAAGPADYAVELMVGVPVNQS